MLSQRARDNNAWFLEQFKRPLARQGSKSASNVDLATAENWLIRPEMLALLKSNGKTLEAKHLSYAGGLGGTPELLAALSQFFNHFFSPLIPVEPQHIVTGPGCGAVLDTLINDLCDDGDALLVTAPMWGEYVVKPLQCVALQGSNHPDVFCITYSYYLLSYFNAKLIQTGSFEVSAVLRNGVRLIPVHVAFEKTHSTKEVVAAYRAAAGKTDRVRGLLFCNPHNPHGHIHPVEVIEALLQYCEETDIHFVSDEIYALSTFGDVKKPRGGSVDMFESHTAEFVSVLSRNLTELGVKRSRVHLLYSISKDLGSSGMRLVGSVSGKVYREKS
jgi:gliotoxin/aspirochlorine biosynthesis aminotransferase